MASSGGGKIRNKRNRGSNKPYQRPKSILSKVTETVAGLIVPTWLRGMLGKNETNEDSDPDPPEAASSDYDTEIPSTSYGGGYPPSRGGQVYAEDDPKGDQEETVVRQSSRLGLPSSTDRAPPKRNVPLPFASYNRPLQTSTPIENKYIPQHREPVTESRDDETDSSVSTSGCSSLLPHVDRADHTEKLARSNLEQPPVPAPTQTSTNDTPSRLSLWSETSTASQERRGSRQGDPKPQPAAKRPRFNASYFGTPRPNTTLTPQERHQSSFYAGRTTFGGSSFYRSPASSKKYNPSPYQVHLPVKRHIRPRPSAQTTMDPDFGVTSNTAMKILNTLDRMSTPLSDAKRIPLTPTPSPFAFKPRRVAVSERKKQVGPPVSGLQVGGQARIISNTQPPPMRVAPTATQPPASAMTTFSSGGAGASSSTAPRVPEPGSEIRLPDAPSTSDGQGSTPIRKRAGIPTSSPPRSGGKMKTKSRNPRHYTASRDEEDELVEVPYLPNIALPISTKAMPTFNFGSLQSKNNSMASASGRPVTNGDLGLPMPCSESVSSQAVPKRSTDMQLPSVKNIPAPTRTADNTHHAPLMTSTPFPSSAPAAQFKFASPVPQESPVSGFTFAAPEVKATAGLGTDISERPSLQEFTFSAPKLKTSESAQGETVGSGFSFTKPVVKKDESTADDDAPSGGIPVATSLKSGSCLQALGSAIPKPSKPQSSSAGDSATSTSCSTSKLSLMDKFRPAPGTWECGSCLVRNEQATAKCVACEAAKPDTTSRQLQTSAGVSLAERFKPTPGSWECSTCSIRNKPDASKCVACETCKPGSDNESKHSHKNGPEAVPLADKFRPPVGSWECSSCWVQNKSDAAKCVACETAKPGAVLSKSLSGNNNKPSLAEMFEPPEGSWTCDTCMIQNKGGVSKCAACESSKPGAPSSTTNSLSQSSGSSIPQSTNVATSLPFGLRTTDSGSTPNMGMSSLTGKPSLSEQFKVEPGSWECDTCMVRNKSPIKRCVACETPKPGTELPLSAPPASSFRFSASSTSTESATTLSSGGFKFGGALPFGKTGDAGATKDDTTLGGGFKTSFLLGSTKDNITTSGEFKGGFSFGAAEKVPAFDGGSLGLSSSLSSKPGDVSSTGGLSLGILKENNQSSGGGAAGSSKSVLGDNKTPPSGGLSFGTSVAVKSDVKEGASFSFGAASSTGDNVTSVGDTRSPAAAKADTSESKENNKLLKSNLFTSNRTTITTAPDSGLTFGGSLSTTPKTSASQGQSHSASSPLAFGVTPQTTNSGLLQFGATTAVQRTSLKRSKDPEPSSTSTDGNNGGFKPTFNFVGADPNSPSVKFEKAAPAKEQKPTLSFGSSQVATAITPQSSSSTPFQFGAATPDAAAANPSAPSKSLFAFGRKPQQTQVPASQTSGFQFGAVSSSSQNAKPAADKPSFTFGAPTTSTNSIAGSSTAASFGSGGSSVFGTAATTPAAAPSGVFGANPPTPQQNATSLFGQTAPQQNSFGSMTNSFGQAATNSVPAFGSGSRGSIPSFGSTAPAFGAGTATGANNSAFGTETKPAPTFQFGQNNNNTTPSSGGFAFGAASNPPPNQTAPNQATGFNFSASQAPTFNFGAPPAGNQQAYQFSAPPKPADSNPFNASAPTSGRKIKKAIRRTGRKT